MNSCNLSGHRVLALPSEIPGILKRGFENRQTVSDADYNLIQFIPLFPLHQLFLVLYLLLFTEVKQLPMVS